MVSSDKMHLIPTVALWGWYCYSHFTERKPRLMGAWAWGCYPDGFCGYQGWPGCYIPRHASESPLELVGGCGGLLRLEPWEMCNRTGRWVTAPSAGVDRPPTIGQQEELAGAPVAARVRMEWQMGLRASQLWKWKKQKLCRTGDEKRGW